MQAVSAWNDSRRLQRFRVEGLLCSGFSSIDLKRKTQMLHLLSQSLLLEWANPSKFPLFVKLPPTKVEPGTTGG
jgi:hypothetical protein